MSKKKRLPWIRLSVGAFTSPKVRVAGAGAVWPWVLIQFKLRGGFVTDTDIHPRIAALDLSIPVETCELQIAGLKEIGLLTKETMRLGTETVNGFSTPNWDEYQPDARPSHRERKRRSGVPSVPVVSPGHVGTAPPNQTVSASIPFLPGVDGDGDGDGDKNVDLRPRSTRVGGGSPLTPDPEAPETTLSDSASMENYRMLHGRNHYTVIGFQRALDQVANDRPGEDWIPYMGMWHQKKFQRPMVEISSEWPVEIINTALKMKTAWMNTLWGFKKLCEDASKLPRKDRSTLRKKGMDNIISEANSDDETLDALIKDHSDTGEMPIPELLPAMKSRLEARGEDPSKYGWF